MIGKARKLDGSIHGGICDMLRAHRPRLLWNCISKWKRTSEWTLERTNEHMTENMDGFFFVSVVMCVVLWTNERMNARTNERTHDGSHVLCCFLFFCYLWCFVLFCCFSPAIINVPTVRNAINPWRADHRRPKGWTNDRRNARTNKWTLKPDWNRIGKSVAKLDRPPKHLSIWVLGPWGEIWSGFGRVNPHVPSGFVLEFPWGTYCQFPELFFKTWFISYGNQHWNQIEA